MTLSPPVYHSAEEAETAFYQAFEAGDFKAMMAIWANGDDLICVHPMGPALHGRAAVEASWREILSGGADMRFSIEPIETYRCPDSVMRIVVEHIAIASGKRVAPMISTNVYRKTPDGWRMVQHHASPSPDQPRAPAESSRLH